VARVVGRGWGPQRWPHAAVPSLTDRGSIPVASQSRARLARRCPQRRCAVHTGACRPPCPRAPWRRQALRVRVVAAAPAPGPDILSAPRCSVRATRKPGNRGRGVGHGSCCPTLDAWRCRSSPCFPCPQGSGQVPWQAEQCHHIRLPRPCRSSSRGLIPTARSFDRSDPAIAIDASGWAQVKT